MKLPSWTPSTPTSMPMKRAALIGSPVRVKPAVQRTDIHQHDPQGEYRAEMAKAGVTQEILAIAGDVAGAYAKQRAADDKFNSALAATEYQHRAAEWTATARANATAVNPATGLMAWETFGEDAEAAFDQIRNEVQEHFGFTSREAVNSFELNVANTNKTYGLALFTDAEDHRTAQGKQRFLNALDQASSHVEIDSLTQAAVNSGYTTAEDAVELTRPVKARLDFRQSVRFATDPATSPQTLLSMHAEAMDMTSPRFATLGAEQRRSIHVVTREQLQQRHMGAVEQSYRAGGTATVAAYIQNFINSSPEETFMPDTATYFDTRAKMIAEFNRMRSFEANRDELVGATAQADMLSSVFTDDQITLADINMTGTEWDAVETQYTMKVRDMPPDMFYRGQAVTEIDAEGNAVATDDSVAIGRLNMARIGRVPKADVMILRNHLNSRDPELMQSAARMVEDMALQFPQAHSKYPKDIVRAATAVAEAEERGEPLVREDGTTYAHNTMVLTQVPDSELSMRKRRYAVRQQQAPDAETLAAFVDNDEVFSAVDTDALPPALVERFASYREHENLANPDFPEIADAVAWKMAKQDFRKHKLYTDRGGFQTFDPVAAAALRRDGYDPEAFMPPGSGMFEDPVLDDDSPFKYLPGLDEDYAWRQLHKGLREINATAETEGRIPVKQSEVRLQHVSGSGDSARFVVADINTGMPLMSSDGTAYVMTLLAKDPLIEADRKSKLLSEDRRRSNMVQQNIIAESGIELPQPFEPHLGGLAVSTGSTLTKHGKQVQYEFGRYSEETRIEETARFTQVYDQLLSLNADREDPARVQKEIMQYMYDAGYKRFDHAGNEITDPTTPHSPLIYVSRPASGDVANIPVPEINQEWMDSMMQELSVFNATAETPAALVVGHDPTTDEYAVHDEAMGYDDAVATGRIAVFNNPIEAEAFAHMPAPEDPTADSLPGTSGIPVPNDPALPPPDRADNSARADTVQAATDEMPVPRPEDLKNASTEEVRAAIVAEATRQELPINLAMAVAEVESNFDALAVSPVGAMGAFQLMPATAKQMGVTYPFDISDNVRGGIAFLKKMLTDHGNNISAALMAYNWGRGNLRRKGPANAPAETREYVRKVLEIMKVSG